MNRSVAVPALALALGVACAPRGAAMAIDAVSEGDESELVALVAGCANRSPRWVDETFRSPVATGDTWLRLMACARARSCDALASCSGIDIRGGYAVESDCKPTCTEGVARDCRLGPAVAIGCARTSRVCSARGPRCVARDARPCGADFVPRCDAGRPVRCVDGEEVVGDDCTAVGLSCAVIASDSDEDAPPRARTAAVCAGVGPACGGHFGGEKPMQCDGDAIVACVGGRIHRADCGARVPNSRCRAVGDPDRPAFACVREGECNPLARDAARCDGNVVTFCNAGRLAHVDCAALGFVACLGHGCTMPRP